MVDMWTECDDKNAGKHCGPGDDSDDETHAEFVKRYRNGGAIYHEKIEDDHIPEE